jgi:hypothetical protein
MKTRPCDDAMLDEVQDDPHTHRPGHESLVRHPIRATEHEAEHLRRVAEEGDGPATPAILMGAVLLFIVPLAALVILLDFGVAHFFS